MKASACQVSSGVWYNSFCCAGGGNPGVSAPPVTSTPSSSPSLTVPAAVSSPEAERDGRRSERGSQAGLTLWPPTAGAEAVTRPASLRKGREGSVETNTRGKLGMYSTYCTHWTHTHTHLLKYCASLKDYHLCRCPCFSLPLSFVPLFLNPISPSCLPPLPISLLSQLPALLSLQDLWYFVQLQPSPALFSLWLGPIRGAGLVRQAGILGHEHLSV